jgi:ribosomal protein S18 acetylase RimI-like enzyme
MTIIPATPADIPFLVPLVNAAYRGEGEGEGQREGRYKNAADSDGEGQNKNAADGEGKSQNKKADNGKGKNQGQDDDSPKGWTNESHLIKGSRTNAAGITELIQAPHSVILKCIDEEGQLAGCVHLEKQEEKLYLGMLSVWPNRQGQGIGKHLLAAAADHAGENNCDNIRITVISARPELIAWYERHGYQRTGEIQSFHAGEKFGIQKQPLELLVLERPV